MKKLIVVVVGMLMCMGLVAGETVKLDPVEKKFKSKLAQIEKRYQTDKKAVGVLMIKEYKKYLSKAMKTNDVELAMQYKNKIKALEIQVSRVNNKFGIIIIKAKWGAEYKWADIKEFMQKTVDNGQTTFRVNSSFFKLKPFNGTNQLVVEYSIKGRLKKVEIWGSPNGTCTLK